MLFTFKNHIKIYLIFVFSILIGCKLQEPSKNHGILFLENRANQLKVNYNNKNDVLKLIGNPHTTSINDENDWIYIERVLTKGAYHKLGQTILKSNNVLILTFDKYGILREKNLLDKNDLKKISFSTKDTENNLSKKSFVETFLSSVKAKMYGNKK